MPATKTSKASRNRTSILFDWLNQVKADPELLPVAFMVAFEIGQHFNSRHSGAAWPGLEKIAKNIGVGKTTVIRTVRQLRERGHLTVEPGHAGRGHSNRYRMANAKIKGPSADLSEPGKRSTGDAKRSIATDLNHLEPSMGNANAFPKRERERSRALAVIPGGADAPDGAAPEEFKQEVIAPGDRFAELLAIWQRPWGEDEASCRKAFAAACHEANSDDIIAAARAWVAAVEPRYLKPLATWLTKGLWKNLPPQRRPARGKVSLSNIVLALTREGGDQ